MSERGPDDSYKILHPTANMSLRVTQYPCKYNNNKNNNTSMNGNTLTVANIDKKKKKNGTRIKELVTY